MTTAPSRRLALSSRSAALLAIALLAAPAPAFAQDTGPEAMSEGLVQGYLSGTSTTAVVSSQSTTALSRPFVLEAWSGDDAGTKLILSTADGVRGLPGLPAPRILDDAHTRAAMPPSLSRHLLIGSGIGAAAGTAFALAVASLADCGGPGCTGEIVIGVASHALAGAVVGALVGGVTYLVRR